MRSKFYLLLLLGLNAFASHAQVIITHAGTGAHGYTGDGDIPVHATFNNCTNVAFDGAGNVYVTDRDNNAVRRINALGIIKTIAGNGAPGYSGDGGAATAAKLNMPSGVAIDVTGNVYIADFGNNVVRRVDTGGKITTYAGNGTAGYSGDEDTARATTAELNGPQGLAVTEAGLLYIADAGNHVVRLVDADQIIHTIAGTGVMGNNGDGGPATDAALGSPVSLAIDVAENVYVADFSNNVVRKINAADSVISTVAGNGAPGFSGDGGAAVSATLRYPAGLSVDGAGNIYIADQANNRIRKVSGGMISTVAGSNASGYHGDGGSPTAAQLNAPKSVAVDGSGRIYIADYGNNVIRLVISPTTVNPSGANNSAINIFPNPAQGSFTILLPESTNDVTIAIADVTGRTIEMKNITAAQSRTQSFDLAGVASGTYIVKVITTDKTISTLLTLTK